MADIEVRHGRDGVEIDLRGEWDLSSLAELRGTLSGVTNLRRPTVVDLSGIEFIDIQATRELAVRSQLYAHHITLLNPSPQVRRSVKACKLGEWVKFSYDNPAKPLEKVS